MNLIQISLLVILISSSLFISDAYAYIDPGSGSLILQMILGALVGAGIAIKVYWFKLKEKFSRR
tara:strand:+ start:2073 stop:2264 length:192 start_codon:yes stop_codon:yes gene_type:complete